MMALVQKVYGNLSAREIIFRLFHLYGRPTLSKIEAANRRLAEPMDRMAPIKVMLRSIKEFQMFFLHNGSEDLSLKETQMINKALIKMNNKGLYLRAIKKWGQ